MQQFSLNLKTYLNRLKIKLALYKGMSFTHLNESPWDLNFKIIIIFLKVNDTFLR